MREGGRRGRNVGGHRPILNYPREKNKKTYFNMVAFLGCRQSARCHTDFTGNSQGPNVEKLVVNSREYHTKLSLIL